MPKVKSQRSAKRAVDMPATKRGAKRREAWLRAAREVFLEKGYAGTSVEDVMTRVGGSKATLYSYFGSKDGLFADLMVMLCDEFLANLAVPQQVEGDIERTLTQFAQRASKLFLDPRRISMLRAVMAEAVRFPQIGQRLYESGPKRGLGMLADFLRRSHDAGQIDCPRPEYAAIQFMEMVKSHAQWRALLGLPPFAQEVDPDEFIRDAVHNFLHGCARKSRK